MADGLDHVRTLQLVQQKKRECLNMAILDGLTSSAISLAVAGGLSWTLQKGSPVREGGGERVGGGGTDYT
jgi:hypothetical protein